jgi:hypothetical protein
MTPTAAITLLLLAFDSIVLQLVRPNHQTVSHIRIEIRQPVRSGEEFPLIEEGFTRDDGTYPTNRVDESLDEIRVKVYVGDEPPILRVNLSRWRALPPNERERPWPLRIYNASVQLECPSDNYCAYWCPNPCGGWCSNPCYPTCSPPCYSDPFGAYAPTCPQSQNQQTHGDVRIVSRPNSTSAIRQIGEPQKTVASAMLVDDVHRLLQGLPRRSLASLAAPLASRDAVSFKAPNRLRPGIDFPVPEWRPQVSFDAISLSFRYQQPGERRPLANTLIAGPVR